MKKKCAYIRKLTAGRNSGPGYVCVGIIVLLLFSFCSASLQAEDLREVPTEELELRLMEISKEQKALSPKLGESLLKFEIQSSELEKRQTMLERELSGLGSSLDELSRSSEKLKMQLTESEAALKRSEESLLNTTDSLTRVQQSWKSWQDEKEKEIRGLKAENIWLWILTGVATAVAVTGLIIR